MMSKLLTYDFALGTGVDFCGAANWCQPKWGRCDSTVKVNSDSLGFATFFANDYFQRSYT